MIQSPEAFISYLLALTSALMSAFFFVRKRLPGWFQNQRIDTLAETSILFVLRYWRTSLWFFMALVVATGVPLIHYANAKQLVLSSADILSVTDALPPLSEVVKGDKVHIYQFGSFLLQFIVVGVMIEISLAAQRKGDTRIEKLQNISPFVVMLCFFWAALAGVGVGNLQDFLSLTSQG